MATKLDRVLTSRRGFRTQTLCLSTTSCLIFFYLFLTLMLVNNILQLLRQYLKTEKIAIFLLTILTIFHREGFTQFLD